MGHSIGGSRYSRKCCQFRLLGATVKYRYAGMVEGLLEESKKKDALIEQLAAQLTEKEPA